MLKGLRLAQRKAARPRDVRAHEQWLHVQGVARGAHAAHPVWDVPLCVQNEPIWLCLCVCKTTPSSCASVCAEQPHPAAPLYVCKKDPMRLCLCVCRTTPSGCASTQKAARRPRSSRAMCVAASMCGARRWRSSAPFCAGVCMNMRVLPHLIRRC